MKTTIFTLFFTIATVGILSANQPVNNSPIQTIQVSENASHTVTVSWNDESYETIEIVLNNTTYMPEIPTSGAKQLHLNNLEDGEYIIKFRGENEVLATKTVTIENHSILASNK